MAVQDHDTALDQLQFRRHNLVERTTAEAAGRDLASVEGEIAGITRELDELRVRQGELEREIDAASERIRTIEKRMYGGEITASRDLEAMAHEVDSLAKRRAGLEDDELEVMEELDPLERSLAALAERKAEVAALVERARSELASAEAVVDAEIARETDVRAGFAASLPAELVGTYERLRARLGGVGAARLVNGSCSGCHLGLSSVELDHIRRAPADAVITCEQCGRILLR